MYSNECPQCLELNFCVGPYPCYPRVSNERKSGKKRNENFYHAFLKTVKSIGDQLKIDGTQHTRTFSGIRSYLPTYSPNSTK